MNERGLDYKSREEAHRRRVNALADEAVKWMPQVDLKLYPSLHISKALRGIPEGRERDRLFGEVRKEVNRRTREARAAKKVQEETDAANRAELDAFREGEKAKQQYKDAYANAWDNQVAPDTGYDPTMPDRYNSGDEEAA